MSEINKPLLIIKPSQKLHPDQQRKLNESAEAWSKGSGFKAVVLGYGVEAEVHHDLMPLVDAITKQTEAIQKLADSNEALIQAMAEAEGLDEDDREPGTYLDGSTLD